MALGLILVAGVSLVLSDAPMLHDYAEWVYQSQVLLRKVTEPAGVAGFVLAPYPVPNALVSVLLAGLGSIFSAVVAAKLLLLGYLGAFFWASWRLSERHPEPALRAPIRLILVAVAALSSWYWYGFLSYQLGLLLLLLYLGAASGRNGLWFLAATGVLIFFSHALVWLIFVLVLGLLVLVGGHPRAQLLALVPSALLMGWYVLGRLTVEFPSPQPDAHMSGWLEFLLYKGGSPALSGPFRNFILPSGHSFLEGADWLYWAGFGANFIFELLAVVLVAWVLGAQAVDWFAGRPLARGSDLAVTAFLLVLLSAYLLAPYNFFGLFNPGGRLVLPILIAALMLSRGRQAGIVDLLAFLAGLFGTVSVGCYLALMIQASTPGFVESSVRRSAPGTPPATVLAFNDWQYRDSPHKLFNYRVFAFHDRYLLLARERFVQLGFRTGLFIDYRRP